LARLVFFALLDLLGLLDWPDELDRLACLGRAAPNFSLREPGGALVLVFPFDAGAPLFFDDESALSSFDVGTKPVGGFLPGKIFSR
jgi:hypothetical protein